LLKVQEKCCGKGRKIVFYIIELADRPNNMLSDWNFHLRPHIQVLTYDQIVKKAKRTVEIIKEVKRKGD